MSGRQWKKSFRRWKRAKSDSRPSHRIFMISRKSENLIALANPPDPSPHIISPFLHHDVVIRANISRFENSGANIDFLINFRLILPLGKDNRIFLVYFSILRTYICIFMRGIQIPLFRITCKLYVLREPVVSSNRMPYFYCQNSKRELTRYFVSS